MLTFSLARLYCPHAEVYYFISCEPHSKVSHKGHGVIMIPLLAKACIYLLRQIHLLIQVGFMLNIILVYKTTIRNLKYPYL